jgi:hypothetical protein
MAKNLNILKIIIIYIVVLSLPCLHAKEKAQRHVASTDGLSISLWIDQYSQ